MESKTSLNKNETTSRVWKTIIRDNFRKFWTVPALGLFWILVWGAVPFLLTQGGDTAGMSAEAAGELAESTRQAAADMAANLNPGYILGILILAVGAGMTVFSYLMHPGASNYMHSLPISRGKLFAANCVSGFAMIAGPLLINAIVMSLVTGQPLLFLKWMIVTGISCFAIFALTALAAMLSGNTLMHLFNAGFVNGILTVVLLTIYAVCDSMLTGYVTSEGWMTLLMDSNALTAFVGSASPRWALCVIYGLVGVAALAAAHLLYRRRAVERTGESVMFPWVRSMLFIICVFCGAVLIGILFAQVLGSGLDRLDHYMCIGVVVGTLLVYIVGALMIDRTAKIFTRRNLLPAALALVLAFGVTAGISSDVLGYSGKVPEADEIQYAYIDLNSSAMAPDEWEYYFGDTYRYDAAFYRNASDENTATVGDHRLMGFKSSETIVAVQNLHRILIAQERGESVDVMGTMEILYKLKNGKQLRRQFDVYAESINGNKAVTDAIGKVYDSKEFKAVYSFMNLKPEVFPAGTAVYLAKSDDEDGAEVSRTIPSRDMDSLQAALEQDFQDCSYAESIKTSAVIQITPAGSSWQDLNLPVPDSGKAMKAWEKAHEDVLK